MLFDLSAEYYNANQKKLSVVIYHKKYEYGAKASIVTTQKSNIIIGVAAHQKNEHDSKTLEVVLSSANKNRTKPIVEAICDR